MLGLLLPKLVRPLQKLFNQHKKKHWRKNMAKNMHIIGRTGNLPDVQRNNLFEVNIPKPTGITSGWDEEGMLIRARTAKIPSKNHCGNRN